MTYQIDSPDEETYEEYLRRVWFNDYLTSGEWRTGQTLFNCAPAYLQAEVRGTKLDPFYQESRIAPFLGYAKRAWRDNLTHLSGSDEDTALCGRFLENNKRTSDTTEADCPQCLWEYGSYLFEEMENDR